MTQKYIIIFLFIKLIDLNLLYDKGWQALINPHILVGSIRKNIRLTGRVVKVTGGSTDGEGRNQTTPS